MATVLLAATVEAWSRLGPAAEAYRRALLAAGETPTSEALAVGADLAFNVVMLTVTAVLVAVLAVVVRRPWQWARTCTWWAAAVLGAFVWIGVGAGSRPVGSNGAQLSELDRLRFALVPSWYPEVTAFLGAALIATLVAAAIVLMRSAAADYYRQVKPPVDPRWAAFLARGNEDTDGPVAGG